MKSEAHHPQQGGVLENTTLVKPEREDNTEPGMRNEICMYLGPHPALSSHCTSCLCIQRGTGSHPKKMQGNKCSPGNLTEGREEQRGPPGLNFFPLLVLIYTHQPHAWKEASQLYRFALLWAFEAIKLLACLFRSN